MEWTASGGYAGYSELTLDTACNSADGTVHYTAGRSDTSRIRLRRSGGSGAAACDLAGAWQEDLDGQGQSTWVYTSLGGGRYRGQETGLGSATATLTVTGRQLRMDWTASGGHAGYSELILDAACNTADGTVHYTAGRSDTSKIRLQRR